MYKITDYIYEVYKEKSFTTASKKLFISQPALSASIKKTEKELGIEIFDRTSNPIKPTEAGLIYIEMIERTRELENNFKNRIFDINHLTVGNITVGCANFITSCILPDILKKFMESYPGITISTIESNSEDLKEKMLSGIIDVVIDYNFDKTLFEENLLKSENIYLCCNKDTEIAKKLSEYAISKEQIIKKEINKVKFINFNLIKDENFILLKKGNDMESRAMHIFKENNIRPKIVLKLDQLMTCYNISQKGLGIAFVTDTMIESTFNNDMIYFKIKSPYSKRNIYIANKQNCIMRNSVKRFIEIAQNTIQ